MTAAPTTLEFDANRPTRLALPPASGSASSVVLWLGDCRDVLPMLEGIDAIVTDPPYGINYSRDSQKSQGLTKFWKGRNVCPIKAGKPAQPIEGDDKPFDPSPWLDFREVILWGANAYSDKLPANYGWLVWNKDIPGEKWNGSDCELAWTNFLGSVRIHKQRWQGIMREGEECPFVGGALVHPTQKPVALMSWCIGLTKGQTVLDPYMGSGTTGLAAVRAKRNFVGIEKDPRHYQTAVERIRNELNQGVLL